MTKYSDSSRSLSVTIKIPTELLKRMESVQIDERLDRTNLIIKCIESYLKEGRTKTEIEVLSAVDEIKGDIKEISSTMKRHDKIIEDLTSAIAALTKNDK